MNKRPIMFFFFLLSGFCGLVYQIVWLRLAFAHFGVVTPVISVVVSVFMLGLASGSWVAGRWIERAAERFGVSPILFYGCAEALVALGAFLVPVLFRFSARSLLTFGEMGSGKYLLASAAAITVSILPWCFLMGTTFPLATAYARRSTGASEQMFSYLYLANVIGAMCGSLLTAAFFVELLGFRNTLYLASACNLLIAGMSFRLARQDGAFGRQPQSASIPNRQLPQIKTSLAYTVLFVTGFSSMGMEIAWTRAFTPITQVTIYAFALLLTAYLLATWAGSFVYRRHSAAGTEWSLEALIPALAVSSFFPLLLNDPRWSPNRWSVLGSLFPVCTLMGYVTSQLVDRHSRGDPQRVGTAYSVNVLGCILGPILTGYLLLSAVGVKWSLFILSLLLAVPMVLMAEGMRPLIRRKSFAGLLCAIWLGSLATSFEEKGIPGPKVVRRDHTATVISCGSGVGKRLFVNGIGITRLTSITKVMAHLPLASLAHRPESALVICFGMGTTFRSLASWGIDVTAVELVPSVRDAFGYYFSDAGEILKKPNVRVVIDDGRRFLNRTAQKFDVITLDPPPPVEAAGSSLLYSREFYESAKEHLRPGGILHQWIPDGEPSIVESVARSLVESFSHVRVFVSIENYGLHFLGSMSPLAVRNAAEMEVRMPVAARRDAMEWVPSETLNDLMSAILSRELKPETLLKKGVPALTDDRPFNEYFFVRRYLSAEGLLRMSRGVTRLRPFGTTLNDP